jgi:DedD protein
MAFFKLRKGGDESAATQRQPESIEAMRKRARHRLIGAGVLVLLGVVGFPLLFDTQPRPIAVDIPIEIPDRNKVKPLTAPSAAAPVAQTTEPKTEAKAEAKAEAKPEPKPETKAEAPAAAGNAGAKAQALLEGKTVSAAAGNGRFVVQVGAFSDDSKAREARAKLERAGLKTYTHVADTKDGKRTRVRVGPFASKAEAEKAADKIKGLDLPASVLTL